MRPAPKIVLGRHPGITHCEADHWEGLVRILLASIAALATLFVASPARAEREWLACVWEQPQDDGRQFNPSMFPPQRVWLSFDPDQRLAWVSNNGTTWSPAQIARLSPDEVHIRARSVFDSSQEVRYQLVRRDFAYSNGISFRGGTLEVHDWVRTRWAGTGECSYY